MSNNSLSDLLICKMQKKKKVHWYWNRHFEIKLLIFERWKYRICLWKSNVFASDISCLDINDRWCCIMSTATILFNLVSLCFDIIVLFSHGFVNRTRYMVNSDPLRLHIGLAKSKSGQTKSQISYEFDQPSMDPQWTFLFY